MGDPPNDMILYFWEYKYGMWGLFVLDIAPPNVSIIELGSLIECETICFWGMTKKLNSLLYFIIILFYLHPNQQYVPPLTSLLWKMIPFWLFQNPFPCQIRFRDRLKLMMIKLFLLVCNVFRYNGFMKNKLVF